MNLELFKEMYAMLWDFIYNLAAIFGWNISNPYA